MAAEGGAAVGAAAGDVASATTDSSTPVDSSDSAAETRLLLGRRCSGAAASGRPRAGDESPAATVAARESPAVLKQPPHGQQPERQHQHLWPADTHQERSPVPDPPLKAHAVRDPRPQQQQRQQQQPQQQPCPPWPAPGREQGGWPAVTPPGGPQRGPAPAAPAAPGALAGAAAAGCGGAVDIDSPACRRGPGSPFWHGRAAGSERGMAGGGGDTHASTGAARASPCAAQHNARGSCSTSPSTSSGVGSTSGSTSGGTSGSTSGSARSTARFGEVGRGHAISTAEGREGSSSNHLWRQRSSPPVGRQSPHPSPAAVPSSTSARQRHSHAPAKAQPHPKPLSGLRRLQSQPPLTQPLLPLHESPAAASSPPGAAPLQGARQRDSAAGPSAAVSVEEAGELELVVGPPAASSGPAAASGPAGPALQPHATPRPRPQQHVLSSSSQGPGVSSPATAAPATAVSRDRATVRARPTAQPPPQQAAAAGPAPVAPLTQPPQQHPSYSPPRAALPPPQQRTTTTSAGLEPPGGGGDAPWTERAAAAAVTTTAAASRGWDAWTSFMGVRSSSVATAAPAADRQQSSAAATGMRVIGSAQQASLAATAAELGGGGGGDSDSEEQCCRVCLEPVSHEQLRVGEAIKLGCRCTSGLDLLHRDCADRWFRGVRCSAVCEVCGGEAAGLPSRMQAAIRWQQLLNPRRGPVHLLIATPDGAGGWLTGSGGSGSVLVNGGGGGGGGGGLPASLPSFLGVYTLVCLMPATLASMGLVLFYYRHVGCDAGVTMALSILTASATIVHWVCLPFRPVLHVLFCMFTLACVFGTTLLLARTAHWPPSLVAAVGAGLGFTAGAALFYGLLHPLAGLARLWWCEAAARQRVVSAAAAGLAAQQSSASAAAAAEGPSGAGLGRA